MKAILVREFGGPEVLKLEEVPTPKRRPRPVPPRPWRGEAARNERVRGEAEADG